MLRLRWPALREAVNMAAMEVSDRAEFLARLNQGFVDCIPYNKAIGFQVMDFGPGEVHCCIPYDAKLVGNPATGVLHGGAITAMLDAACGGAVFMALKRPSRIATIDLRIDYLRPATPGESVYCRAHCYKVTRQVAFVRAVAYGESGEGDAIASAAGAFMIFRSEKSLVAERVQASETPSESE